MGVVARGVNDRDVPVSVDRLFAKKFFTSGVLHCMDAVPLFVDTSASHLSSARSRCIDLREFAYLYWYQSLMIAGVVYGAALAL